MARFVANRWFLPASALVFGLGGLAAIVFGDSYGRVIGWTVLMFGGVGAGAAAIGENVAGPPADLVRGRVALPDGATTAALILAYRRYPAVIRATIGVGMAAGCAIFALAPRTAGSAASDNAAARILLGLAGLYFLLATALRLRHGGLSDSIALTAPGLLASSAGTARYVAWSDVKSVVRTDLRGSPMLTVTARSADAIVRSGGAGVLDGLGAFFYGNDRLPISLRSLSLTPDHVVALMQRFHEHGVRGGGGVSDGSAGGDPAWFSQVGEAAGAR